MLQVGDGGITILPGACLNNAILEDDWRMLLEGPPSPCDVMFMNDSIIINGRSSFNKDNSRKKVRYLLFYA